MHAIADRQGHGAIPYFDGARYRGQQVAETAAAPHGAVAAFVALAGIPRAGGGLQARVSRQRLDPLEGHLHGWPWRNGHRRAADDAAQRHRLAVLAGDQQIDRTRWHRQHRLAVRQRQSEPFLFVRLRQQEHHRILLLRRVGALPVDAHPQRGHALAQVDAQQPRVATLGQGQHDVGNLHIGLGQTGRFDAQRVGARRQGLPDIRSRAVDRRLRRSLQQVFVVPPCLARLRVAGRRGVGLQPQLDQLRAHPVGQQAARLQRHSALHRDHEVGGADRELDRGHRQVVRALHFEALATGRQLAAHFEPTVVVHLDRQVIHTVPSHRAGRARLSCGLSHLGPRTCRPGSVEHEAPANDQLRHAQAKVTEVVVADDQIARWCLDAQGGGCR